MAWRLYKGAAVKDIAIPLFLPREPATEPSLFLSLSLSIEGKCSTEWHPDQIFLCRVRYNRRTASDNFPDNFPTISAVRYVTARSPHLMLDKPKV